MSYCGSCGAELVASDELVSIPAIAGITVHVQGHGGRQYFKKVLTHPDGTLPSSALFDPDNPLSGGWRERGSSSGHNKTKPYLTWTTEKDEEVFDD